MGNELEACCGMVDHRYQFSDEEENPDGSLRITKRRQTLVAKRQDAALAWEAEAHATWERIDPVSYHAFIAKMTADERDRAAAAMAQHNEERRRKKAHKKRLRREAKAAREAEGEANSFLADVDHAVDELLGFRDGEGGDARRAEGVSLEMTAVSARPSPASDDRRAGFDVDAGNDGDREDEEEDEQEEEEGGGGGVGVGSSGGGGGGGGDAAAATRAPLLTPEANIVAALAAADAEAEATLRRAAGGGAAPAAPVVPAPAAAPRSVPGPVDKSFCDQLLRHEFGGKGWGPTSYTFSKKSRPRIQIYQQGHIGWTSMPPYQDRVFKIVHLIKGPIDAVWTAWNDVAVRQRYDKDFKLAKVLTTIDDTCDGGCWWWSSWWWSLTPSCVWFCLSHPSCNPPTHMTVTLYCHQCCTRRSPTAHSPASSFATTANGGRSSRRSRRWASRRGGSASGRRRARRVCWRTSRPARRSTRWRPTTTARGRSR